MHSLSHHSTLKMTSVSLEFVVFVVLVVRSYGKYTTVNVPSGPNSTLENFLCSGLLLSNTSLHLEAGEHRISPGPFCSVVNVSRILITGSGEQETIIHCNEQPRGFQFSTVQNLTIQKVTFVGCGQNHKSSQFTFASPVTLMFVASSTVTIQQLTITELTGIGVIAYNTNDHFVMREVKILNCNGGNCSGALFFSDPLRVGGPSDVLLQSCCFKHLEFIPSIQHERVFIGAALTLWEQTDVVVYDSQFAYLDAPVGAAISVVSSSVLVDDSDFTDNLGNKMGAISANSSTVEVSNSSFTRNVLTDDNGEGGAIYMYASKINIVDSSFDSNSATTGGAVFICRIVTIAYQYTLTRSKFIRNHAEIGAAIYACAFAKENDFANYSFFLVDTLVKDNECSSGKRAETKGAAVYFNEVRNIHIKGSEFTGNFHQGAIQVWAGRVHLLGDISFKNNTGENGGALSLSNNARLYFHQNCNVQFFENKATRSGGAVYIQVDLNIAKSSCSVCALNFPGEYENWSIIFTNNTALANYGQSIYAAPIYHCDITIPLKLNPYLLKYGHFGLYTRIFNITTPPDDQILSIPVNVHICRCDDNTECEVVQGKYHIISYPGRTVKFRATSSDSNNHPSPSVIYTDIHPGSRGIELGYQQKIQWIDKDCELIEYQIFGPENISFSLHLSTFPDDIPYSIKVTLKSCERGFMLSYDNKTNQKLCNCSNFLTMLKADCNANSGTISRHKNVWVGDYHKGSQSYLAAAYTCPLDYCNNSVTELSLGTPDALCNKGRTGVLCGHCLANFSVVFGSSECQLCSNIWLLTILLYAVLGIVLVAVLFMLNLTVTQGTIYGLIFYANIIEVNNSIFFNGSFMKPLQIIISFINLDLGFPMCFYDGMDDAAKTGLQFVFPAYLITLTITVVMICHYCLQSNYSGHCLDRFNRFVGKRAVSVVATLIYLSYSKLLRTVISIFTFITIHVDLSEKTYYVWFYDGNIKYLKGKHLLLFVIAIAITIFFLFPYTLALTLIPIIDRYSDHSKLLHWLNQKANLLKPMNDAYYAPYKGAWRSWLGVRLLLLVCLYAPTPVVASENPSLLLYIHSVLVILFLFVQAQVKPFSYVSPLAHRNARVQLYSHVLNLLDSYYMINYSILALTVSYFTANSIDDKHRNIAVGILVGLSGLVLVATFLYHVIIAVLKVCTSNGDSKQEWTEHREETLAINEQTAPSTSVEMRPFSVYGDLREPLMEKPGD